MSGVITISRQFGSGGREIGAVLAKTLGVPDYDRQLFLEASRESGIHETFFEKAEEGGSRLLSHAFDSAGVVTSTTLSDRIFLAQADAIRRLAERGPCVIVGCGGNYILKGRRDALHVFIHGDDEMRIDRIAVEYGVERRKAEKMMRSADKSRAAYIKSYTNQEFGMASNYHISIDSGWAGADGAVRVILEAYRSL